eukprot:7382550-Prymnesium_polylepis.1
MEAAAADTAAADTAESPVKGFLEPLRLGEYRQVLKDAGYDDVDDFAAMDDAGVAGMQAALAAGGMKPGHLGKLLRVVNQLRTNQHGSKPAVDAGAAAAAAAPPPPPQPSPPSPQSSHAAATDPDAAAGGTPSVRPDAQAELPNLADWPLAQSFLAQHGEHGRVYTGRDDHSLVLNPHQIAMNAAILKLIYKKPWQLRRDGRAGWKLGAYTVEARQMVDADPSFTYGKAKGS